jgi:crotonobetainyl-CoA:carnitine CoA-transferase CaiB-like acyl-CoA transferase
MAIAIDAAARGETPARTGNDDARVFHQGVYATQGEDRWLALTLRNESEWEHLRTSFALPVATSAADRDRILAQRFAKEDDHELMEQLQLLGIAAGAVQDIEDTMERDPQLKARGALWKLDHAVLGSFGHVRTPITFSRSVLAPFRAPSLGEHNEQIAADIAGISAERIAALKELGVFK